MAQGSVRYVPSGCSKVYNRDGTQATIANVQQTVSKAAPPPRIEKWVMDMQDVDFELKYEPGRDELDPLDFLSRHPLPVIGNDDTEKVLKSAITTEHAVVLDRIREETSQDRVLRKLSQTIRKGNWESSKRDADLIPFYQVKEKL